MPSSYVTPDDMKQIYDEAILVQATNYSDRLATTIDDAMLQKACESSNQIVEGYLVPLGVPTDRLTASFQEILKPHAARLALDHLAGTDPQVRELAKESIEYLKSLSKLSNIALDGIVDDEDGEGDLPGVPPLLPVVFFDEGRRWGVTF